VICLQRGNSARLRNDQGSTPGSIGAQQVPHLNRRERGGRPALDLEQRIASNDSGNGAGDPGST
jgi:hypothetical protein